MIKESFLRLFTAFNLCIVMLQATAQNSYIVTTHDEPAPQSTSATDKPQPDNAELRFLHEHFPYISQCNWQPGMRFMVVPGEQDAFIRTFTDSITGREVPTNALKHKIMIYKGTEVTPRGWIHINFYCPDMQKTYYHQVRNLTIEEYCAKVQEGGIATLACLDDVDRARELLLGKELWLKQPYVCQDSEFSPTGYVERKVPTDMHVKVERIGVGTREHPVKIVFRADNGQLFYQSCAMSCINSGMLPIDFLNSNTQHYFANAFSFTSGIPTNSAIMARKLVNKYLTLRRPIKMKADGTTRNIAAGTRFIVERVTAHGHSDYYTLMMTNNNKLHELDVTFFTSRTNGSMKSDEKPLFDDLFTVGETYSPSGPSLDSEYESYGDGTGANFMNMLGGSVSKGMSQDEVKLIKGTPTQVHTLNGGTSQWDYYDVKIQFNKAGQVTRIINIQ